MTNNSIWVVNNIQLCVCVCDRTTSLCCRRARTRTGSTRSSSFCLALRRWWSRPWRSTNSSRTGAAPHRTHTNTPASRSTPSLTKYECPTRPTITDAEHTTQTRGIQTDLWPLTPTGVYTRDLHCRDWTVSVFCGLDVYTQRGVHMYLFYCFEDTHNITLAAMTRKQPFTQKSLLWTLNTRLKVRSKFFPSFFHSI